MGNKTNADYFNDKRKAELMKQGRGLAALSVILIVLALLLGLVFVDVSFVPEGEMWEQCRESMKEYFAVYGDGEDVSGYSDRELWGKIKDEMAYLDLVPFKSGLMCWNTIVRERNAEAERLAKKEEKQRQAEEIAKETMGIFNAFLSEKEIFAEAPQIVQIHLFGENIYLTCVDIFTDSYDDEGKFLGGQQIELEKRLSEIFPNKGKGEVQAYIREGKCVSVVYAPDVDNIYEGVDFPYLDENGCFDEERDWGFGVSEVHNNGYIIGYIDENGNG